jgi:putative hydrolase of the HAD superfamily
MIKVIVFDIGNVLAPFEWEECLRNHGFSDEMVERIGKATVRSPLWKELDRSVTIGEELIEGFIAYDPAIASEIRQFMDFSGQTVREADYSADLITRLKDNGYKVYLLSNYSGSNYQYAREHFQFIKLADGAVISYEVGSVKPEPEIFQALIKKYDIKPEEAVFLDDLKVNTEAAASHGFHTIQFQNLEQSLKEMRKLGIHI